MNEALRKPAFSAGPDLRSLLADGARTLSDDGDLRASRALFDAAYRTAERIGDPIAMAHAALGLGGLWVHEHRTTAAAVAVRECQRRALSYVDPQSSVGLRLRIRIAAEDDYLSGGSGSILAMLDEATSATDSLARAEALSLAHHCLLGADQTALRRALADELVAEGARTRRRSDLLMGLLWQTVDQFLAADRHAERSLGQLRQLLSRRGHRAVGHIVSAVDVMLAIRAGKFELAERLARVCAERGEAAGAAEAPHWHHSQLVAIRWFQGRLAEMLPTLSEMMYSRTLSAVDNSYFAAAAIAVATAGDWRTAADAHARLRRCDLADLPRSGGWLVTMYGIAEAAYLLGDAEQADTVYGLLSPYTGAPMMVGLGVACFGSVQYALGVAALTAGAAGRAVEHLRAAEHDNLVLGHLPAASLSRTRLSQALAMRDNATTARCGLTTAARDVAGLVIRASEAGPHGTTVVCRRRGRLWQVTWGRRTALVEHLVGMQHLAALVANPGREIAAVELAAGPGHGEAHAAAVPQPVLDEVARRRYRERLAELTAEIDELESANDLERAAKARGERDWLIEELAAATGMAGRARHFAGNAERARIAVGKALRRAIDRIANADPAIGAELKVTVCTGGRCSYQPRGLG